MQDADAGALAALAYPDRVAIARKGQRGRFVTRQGGDVMIDAATAIAGEEFIVAVDLDGRKPVSRAYLAVAIARETVEALFAGQVETTREIEWNPRTEAVDVLARRKLGALVLGEKATRADPSEVASALARAAIGRGLLDNEDLRSEIERIAFARSIEPDRWPLITIAELERTAEAWLIPALAGSRTLAEATRADLAGALLGTLDFQQRRRLDEMAPRYVEVPTGSRIRVDYRDPAAPSIAVRIQEVFGLAESPRVGLNQVPVTMHLLSPAQRPVQVTRDLAGFWKSSYFDVRKDLRGRYPRHPWPDDPAHATPTRRAKPRGQ